LLVVQAEFETSGSQRRLVQQVLDLKSNRTLGLVRVFLETRRKKKQNQSQS